MFADPIDKLSTLFKSCAKTRILRLSLSSGFFFARSSTQSQNKEFVLCIQFSFVKLDFSSNLQTKILMEFSLEIQIALS
jgi:hypothetical protein